MFVKQERAVVSSSPIVDYFGTDIVVSILGYDQVFEKTFVICLISNIISRT